MYLTDPIADMLTRVRNANAVMHEKVDIPHSKMKERIAEILKEQGYISNFKIVTDEGNKKRIRVYSSVEDMPRVLSGLGIAIVSTSKGVITDKVARAEKVGGEVLAFVW